jgi:ATP-dependent Clp protease adapter protein ClpS
MGSEVTATRTRRAERTRAGEETRRSHEPPWNVILHNDRNQINRVVWRLWRTIPDMTMKKATGVTWEAHTKGRAVAKTCHRELAELYEERLHEKGLTVSIESGR